MPASSAAASTARPSAASRAKGFSHSTCLPAAMAARAMACVGVGRGGDGDRVHAVEGEGLVHRGEGRGECRTWRPAPPSWPGRGPTRATTSNPAARRARTWVTQPKPVPTTTTPVIGPLPTGPGWRRRPAAPPRRPDGHGARRENTSTPRGAVVPVATRAPTMPTRSNSPSPGRARSWSVASTRLSSAAARPVVELDTEDQLAGDARPARRGRCPTRTRCQASTLIPPLGAPARRTMANAVARSGIFDQGSHSMWTSRPCSAARPHSPAKASAASSTVPVPAEDVDRVDRAGAHGVGHREQVGLAEAEDVLAVVAGGDVDVGRTRQPPPGRVELGHGQAVVVEHRPQVGVAQPLGPRRGVVATPQRDGGEAGRRPRRPPARRRVTCRGSVPEHRTRSSGPISSRPPGRRHRAAVAPSRYRARLSVNSVEWSGRWSR